jgi:peptidase S41-like protein
MTRLRAIIVGLTACLAAAAVSAQPPGPPPPPAPLDAAARTAVVKAAADALRQRYVYPDVGRRAAEAIEAALAAGKYDEIVQPWAFAERLTADLREIAHDKHLNVTARGPAPVPAAATGTPPPGPPPRSEAGVTRSDRLPGNIGYIEVVALPGLDAFKGPVDKAMAGLADTRALIVDLRRNGGGTPQAEVYLTSYLLDPAKPIAVNRFVWRNPGTETFRTEDFMSSPTPYWYRDKPVYVLTSARTFSGGEAVAYDMQALKLATIVGETTGGGANPGGGAPLTPDFGMFMPGGRGENPTTGTNWEGVGVKPDVAVPAADALKAALGLLGYTTDKTEIEALSEARLFEPRKIANPLSETTLRRVVAELARGEPNYDLMTPGMGDVTRQQLPQLQQLMQSMGALESVTFAEVDVQGGDAFDVKFANGALRFSVVVNAEGKMAGAGIRPLGPLPGAAPASAAPR